MMYHLPRQYSYRKFTLAFSCIANQNIPEVSLHALWCTCPQLGFISRCSKNLRKKLWLPSFLPKTNAAYCWNSDIKRVELLPKLECTVLHNEALKDLFHYIVKHGNEFEDTVLHSAEEYISNRGKLWICLHLLTTCLHEQMGSMTFYRINYLQFCTPGVDKVCIFIEVLIKYMKRLCRTTACQADGEPTQRVARKVAWWHSAQYWKSSAKLV